MELTRSVQKVHQLERELARQRKTNRRLRRAQRQRDDADESAAATAAAAAAYVDSLTSQVRHPVHPQLKRVTGVTFNSTLSCDPHVRIIAASPDALKTVRCHGVGMSPGLLRSQNCPMLAHSGEASLTLMKQISCRLCLPRQCILNIYNLISQHSKNGLPGNSGDFALFRNLLTNPKHVLRQLQPSRKHTLYELRNLSRGLILPQINSCLLRNNNFLPHAFYGTY